jgi:hypothetical protein
VMLILIGGLFSVRVTHRRPWGRFDLLGQLDFPEMLWGDTVKPTALRVGQPAYLFRHGGKVKAFRAAGILDFIGVAVGHNDSFARIG